MTDHFIDIFLPDEVPRWLVDFQSNPAEAVDQLLRSATYFEVDESPALTLLDYDRLIPEEFGFHRQLDATLATWISSHSDVYVDSDNAYSTARAWVTISAILTYLPDLRESADALRPLVDGYEHRFASLRGVRGDDVVEGFLHAIASTQVDRAMAPLWWNLTRLSGTIHPNLGYIGIVGIEKLPPLDDEERGGFRDDVAEAVFTYGSGLLARSNNGALAVETARRTFESVLAIFRAAYPFPERWHEAAGRVVDGDGWVAEWVDGHAAKEERPDTRRRRPRRAVAGADPLLAGSAEAADHILEARAREVRTQLDVDVFAQALIDTAHRFRRTDPEFAVRWSSRAISWAPWNSVGWNIHTSTLRRVKDAEATLPLAWLALERFPENPVCWQELGTSLAASGRTVEAEEIWRDTLERFDNPHTLNALGKLLMDQRRPNEALVFVEPYVRERPEDRSMSSLLGHIYRALERYDDAENHFRSLLDAAPGDSYGWYGLLSVLRDQGRFDDLAPILSEARVRFPDVALIQRFDPEWSIPSLAATDDQGEPTSIAEVRTRRRRLERLADDGEDVRSTTMDLIGALDAVDDGGALVLDRSAERALLMAQNGELERAVTWLGSLYDAFPQSPKLAYALARVNRVVAVEDRVKYDKAEFSRLYSPMRRFREELPGSRLLGKLAAVNLAASMTDGKVLTRRREELLQGLLGERDRGHASRSEFESWWLACVVERTGPLNEPAGAPDVAAPIVANRRVLNQLEEDFANRLLAPAGVPPSLLTHP